LELERRMAAGTQSTEPKTPRALLWMLAGMALVLVIAAIGVGAITRLPDAGSQGAASIGGPFRLQAGGGKSVADTDLRGAPFLVFFGYTHCPDICPTTLFQLSQVLKALGPEAKIKVLFVTVDPDRDTPELMQQYAESFDHRIIGLSGDRATVEKVLSEYRVYARKAPTANGDYTMDHSAVTYLMGGDGKFLRAFNVERPPEQAAADLKPLL
jgi:protein SCO1/2